MLHPAQVLGQPTFLPVQQCAECEGPEPALGRFGEKGEDLVVGVGEPAPVAELPFDELRQAVLHLHQTAPGALFSRIQPSRRHALTIPLVDMLTNGSYRLVHTLTR